MCRGFNSTIIRLFCLVTIFLVERTCSSPSIKEDEDPTTLLSDKEKLRLHRLATIQQQILDKLRLKSLPNITRPIPSFPRPLMEINSNQNSPENRNLDDYYGYTTQIIVFAEEDKTSCKEYLESPCLDFRLSSKFAVSEVISTAQLWLYKIVGFKGNENLTLNVRLSMGKNQPGLNREPGKFVVKKTLKKRFKGWLKIEVGEMLQAWLSSIKDVDKSFFTVSVTYENADRHFEFLPRAGMKPFLVINTDTSHQRRTKRFAVKCNAKSKDCCRESFYVAFSDLDWDNWIIQPKGYKANYCRGSCEGHLLPKHHHTSVMQRLNLVKSGVGFTPCCTPTKMSGLSLLYFNEDGNIEKKNLPNMVVDECKCA